MNFPQLIETWTTFITSRPRQVLGVVGMLTLGMLYVAVSQFSINSDTSRLIRQDTEWRANYDAFEAAFPRYRQNSLVVVHGRSIDAVTSVGEQLFQALTARTEVFETVWSPINDPVLARHALLFLSVDELEQLLDNLAGAQPVLAALAEDPSSASLFAFLTTVIEQDEVPDSILPLLDLLQATMVDHIAGNGRPVAWRDELRGSDEPIYNIIYVQGRQDFGEQLPNARIVNTIRDTIAQLEHPLIDDVSIRLTGQVPLEHGEIESAVDSAQLAGTLAILLLALVLVFGVKSARVIGATYLSMIVGLIWTTAIANLLVGQFNTISIIFLVMFIGLGVDFAIHLSLRYQEAILDGDKNAALLTTSRSLGVAITLCGITSSIGFLAFVPTEYLGLAELGIISGAGMIIAVVVTLTVIPAFFSIVATPRHLHSNPLVNQISMLVGRHPQAVVGVTLVFGALCSWIGSSAMFDYSTLSLKDPNSEAMQTFRELQDQDVMTEYTINYPADNEAMALELSRRLSALPSVSSVVTPADYLPADQEEKRYILEDARFMLGSTLAAALGQQREAASDPLPEIRQLISTVENYDGAHQGRINELATVLSQLAASDKATRLTFDRHLVEPALDELNWLQQALAVKPLTLEALPSDLKERFVSNEGQYLVTVTPAGNIIPVEAMRRFTEDVLDIIPTGTGRPVIDLGIGEIVVTAFQQAIAIAVTAIFIILVITLRSVTDAVLVFIPLGITAMFTLTMSVMIDLPLNMANVVVIPLIFGLGVDNGIHVVERFRESASLAALSTSSTPNAVFLSTLTTLGTFSALSFSSHQGIYSIGVLLTMALIALMFLTMVSLPALLSVFSNRRQGAIESLP